MNLLMPEIIPSFLKRQAIVLLIFILLPGCAIKEWDYVSGEFSRISDEYMYAEAFATSSNLELAVSKAEGLARAKLLQQINTTVDASFKTMVKELGAMKKLNVISETELVTEQVSQRLHLSGSVPVQTKWRQNKDGYEAFVLMELPISSPKIALYQTITSQEDLYTLFRNSNLFKELEESTRSLKK